MDLLLKSTEEFDVISLEKSVFDWVASMGEDIFKQVMDNLTQFENSIEDFDSFVFVVMADEPIYFGASIEIGTMQFDDSEKPRDTYIVYELQKIDLDVFLDCVLEGKQIIKNKDLKRLLIHYEFI